MKISTSDKSIGARLRQLRLSRGLTQRNLAKKLGFSAQQLQKYEMGHNKLSFDRVLYLSKYFEVPLDYWVTSKIIRSRTEIFDEDITEHLTLKFMRGLINILNRAVVEALAVVVQHLAKQRVIRL